MKKILKSAIAFFIIFIMHCTAFAQVTANTSDDAKKSMTEAYELGLVSEEFLQKAAELINREDFCELIVKFYRLYTGESGITQNNSPFYDISNNAVTFAYEKEIVSGVTKTRFDPNAFVTREQMAVMIFKTLETCGANTNIVLDKKKIFTDLDKVSGSAQEYVKKLGKVGILTDINEKFKPNENITMEEAIGTFLNAYHVFQNYDFSIGGKKISIGDTAEKVENIFGNPDRIDDNQYGFERYIYNKDYENFVIIGIQEGIVAEIYTNSPNFSYRSITPKTTRFEIEKAIYEDDMRQMTTLKDGNTITSIYFDKDDEYSIEAIYIKSDEISGTRVENINDDFIDSTIQELFDIINASRAKKGLKELKWDDVAAVAAQNHSVDMKENAYLEYNNKDGKNPFERMQEAGVKFITASEAIANVRGDAIDIYHSWFSNAGTKNNLFSSDLDYAGIGISADGFDVYVTMDLYHP